MVHHEHKHHTAKSLPMSGASWAHTKWLNHYQGVLPVGHPSSVQCKRLHLLVAPSQQWSCSLFSSETDYLGQTQHLSGMSHCYLSHMASCDVLLAPQAEAATERNLIWAMRKHAKFSSPAVIYSKRGFPERLPTMSRPLGEVFVTPRRAWWRGLWFQTCVSQPKVRYSLNRPRTPVS